MKDIIYGILALILVGILLTVTRNAFAGEWFPESAIYLDVTPDTGNTYCRRSDGHASHLGARVDLYAHGPHTFRTIWVHNSCVEEEDDKRSRDALGIGYEYELW